MEVKRHKYTTILTFIDWNIRLLEINTNCSYYRKYCENGKTFFSKILRGKGICKKIFAIFRCTTAQINLGEKHTNIWQIK